ncbi:hypothetical protein QZH41_014231 [Actinostola sp. cb2023]|nr:hypothetical protein QZH41_014231 [Actinostola sp. cb2023]
MAKKLKAAKVREERLMAKFERELLAMEEEDHNDLKKMMEDNGKENLPEDMMTLWDQQKKILETSSSKGYRWHPKIIKLCLELYCKNPHVLEPLRKVMQ